MPNILRRSADCIVVRGGPVRLGCDVRPALKDVLIDIAHDQRRSLSSVVQDALDGYARDHWLREESYDAC